MPNQFFDFSKTAPKIPLLFVSSFISQIILKVCRYFHIIVDVYIRHPVPPIVRVNCWTDVLVLENSCPINFVRNVKVSQEPG